MNLKLIYIYTWYDNSFILYVINWCRWRYKINPFKSIHPNNISEIVNENIKKYFK